MQTRNSISIILKASFTKYLICLIFILFTPYIPKKQIHLESIYGAGDWKSIMSKIHFQTPELKETDQISQALSKGQWKTTGSRFSPISKNENDLIYQFTPAQGASRGTIHLATQIYNNNGYINLSISNDGQKWLELVEDGFNWHLSNPKTRTQEGWVLSKHDLSIPKKFINKTTYIKLSGACRTENDWVSVEQWGIKTWSYRFTSLYSIINNKVQISHANKQLEGSFWQRLKNRFAYRYHPISTPAKITTPLNIKEFQNISDQNPFTHISIPIPGNKPAPLLYTLPSNTNISKIQLFFWGDLHRATSYHAIDYEIQVLSNQIWMTITKVEGNASPLVSHIIPNHLSIDQIKIIFTKAYLDQAVALAEVSLYTKEAVPLWKGIYHYLVQYNKSLPACFLYTAWFIALLFLPGFCITQFFPNRTLDSEDKFIFSFFFSIILYFILSLLGLFSNHSSVFYFVIPIFIISLILCLYQGWYRQLYRIDKTLLFLLPIFLFFSLLYQHHRDLIYALPFIENYLDTLDIPSLPYYGYHGDNLFPWRLSKVYLHHMDLTSPEIIKFTAGTTVFARTPLLPLLNVPFLFNFGESHFIYQKLLTILAGLFLLPLYCFIKNLFNPRIAKLTVYLILLNNFFFYLGLSVDVYHKYFALYPAVTLLLLYTKRGISHYSTTVLASLLTIIATSAHLGMAFLYLFAAFIYVLLKERSKIHAIKWIAIMTLSFSAVIILWKWYSFHVQPPQINSIATKDLHLSLLMPKDTNFILVRLKYIWEIFAPFSKVKHWFGWGGLVTTYSSYLFVIFVVSACKLYNTHKYILPLIFLPPLIFALLYDLYLPGATMHGCYLAIPLMIALSLTFLQYRNIIWTILFIIFYFMHNFLLTYENGNIFSLQMLDFMHLQIGHILTLAGLFLFTTSILIIIFKSLYVEKGGLR